MGRRYEQAESGVLAAMGALSRLPAETWQIRVMARDRLGLSYDRVQAALRRLTDDGRVVKVRRGWYDLPDDSPYKRRTGNEA